MPHSGQPPILRQSSAARLNAPHNPPQPSGLPNPPEHAAHALKQNQRPDAAWRLPLVRAGQAVPFASPWRRRPMHAGAGAKPLAQKTNGALANDSCASEKFRACDVRKAHPGYLIAPGSAIMGFVGLLRPGPSGTRNTRSACASATGCGLRAPARWLDAVPTVRRKTGRRPSG